MTSEISTLPAFPVPENAQSDGIAARDWFACVALQGLVARGLEIRGDRVMTEVEKANEFATRAYRMADAMLRIRETEVV